MTYWRPPVNKPGDPSAGSGSTLVVLYDKLALEVGDDRSGESTLVVAWLTGWLAGWLLVIVKIYFALASVEIVTCPSTSHRMNDRLNLNPTKQQKNKLETRVNPTPYVTNPSLVYKVQNGREKFQHDKLSLSLSDESDHVIIINKKPQ